MDGFSSKTLSDGLYTRHQEHFIQYQQWQLQGLAEKYNFSETLLKPCALSAEIHTPKTTFAPTSERLDDPPIYRSRQSVRVYCQQG